MSRLNAHEWSRGRARFRTQGGVDSTLLRSIVRLLDMALLSILILLLWLLGYLKGHRFVYRRSLLPPHTRQTNRRYF